MRAYKKDTISSTIKVSVIVPVYNVEKYIEECLDSLIEQTFPDIEILLIDDGSKDLSGRICDEYAQKYEHVHVIHKENQGLGNARNIGFYHAKGKYVYFIDSDDALDKDALQYLYQEAEKDDLDIILFSAECFSDDSEINYNPLEYKRTAFLDEVKTGRKLFFELASVGEYYASIPLRFYSRTFLKEHNFRFPENIIHEDEAYGCLSLINAGRVKCVKYPFYKRRFRKGSIMTSNKAYQSAIGYIYTWNVLMEAEKSLGFNEKERQVYNKFAGYFFSRTMELYYKNFSGQEKLEFRRIRYEIRNSSCYKKLRTGRKFFIKNPFLYRQCRRCADMWESIKK